MIESPVIMIDFFLAGSAVVVVVLDRTGSTLCHEEALPLGSRSKITA